jgi:hypothetical protein
LSKEWLKELAALAGTRPRVPGQTGTVTVTVTGGPTGDVSYHWRYDDGIPGGGGIGAAEDADLTLTVSSADALAVANGEVEPSVAYMRGRLKASGDGALLLEWLASTATGAYDSWRQQVMTGVVA